MVTAKGVDQDTDGYVHVLIGNEWPKDHVERNALIENSIELVKASRALLALCENFIDEERDPFVMPNIRKVLSKLEFVDKEGE